MWAGSNAVGLIGLVLNVYMCMTWSDHLSYLLLLSLPALHVPFFFVLSTWFGVKLLHAHDLVRSYIISACTIRFLIINLITSVLCDCAGT